jgi:LPXTG-motif cell wall-anchored protein
MNRQPKPAAKPPAKPMIARTKAPKESEGGGWLTWAMVGVGLVLLGGAGFLFVRRNNAGGNGSEEVDFSDDAGDTAVGELDDAPIPVDEKPFAGMDEQGDQMNLAPSDEATMPALMDHDDDSTVIVDDSEKEAETVVFDDGSEGETMDVISRDQVNESLGEMPPVGGVSDEVAQMMRAMERRVQALEGRIDELVDARDRLERQVAAQTEELRVQRAAIARTQRAVRNLARPEDEVAPEEATEPALRDPNKPSMDS